jgi:hypothetical protein
MTYLSLSFVNLSFATFLIPVPDLIHQRSAWWLNEAFLAQILWGILRASRLLWSREQQGERNDGLHFLFVII